MQKITIIPENVCCDSITVEHENGVLGSVTFENGCNGNGKALGRLLAGMRVEEAVQKLAGVNCEGKGTSCADQLARGLREQISGK